MPSVSKLNKVKQVQDDIVLVFMRHGQNDEMINVERLTRNRLEDGKLNSRGLLSPWKPRHTPTENRLEDGNRQRIQRLKVDGHADHTLCN